MKRVTLTVACWAALLLSGGLSHAQVVVPCGGETPLKRHVVTTYFTVEQPASASDLPSLATFLPAEFSRRLSLLPRYSASNAGGVTVLPSSAIEPIAGENGARLIGQREDAQFVVTGRVIDTSVVSTRTNYSILDNAAYNGGTLNYIGPLGSFLGARFHTDPLERQFDFEVWVYDAFTGALMKRERFADVAKVTRPIAAVGAVGKAPLGSAAFWREEYGRMMDTLLDKAVGWVDGQLACQPYMTKVAQLDGGRIYLKGGDLDGLKVGDRLAIYKQRPLNTLRAAGSGHELGVPETFSGNAVVVQVQPAFAVAEVKSSRYKVEVGDILRFSERR